MTNPYQPPESDLNSDNLNIAKQLDVKTLSAAHGWLWFKDAFYLFMKSPLIWLVNFIIFIVIVMTLSVIPLVSLIAQIITPIFIGGIMMGCRELDSGNKLSINHLFAGFKHNTSQFAGLGIIQLIASIIIVIAPAIMLIPFGILSMSDIMNDSGMMMPNELEFFSAIMLYMLLIAAFLIPLIMGIWFAACLIAFNNLEAWAAFKLSYKACSKNWLAFLVYGLVGLLLTILALIPAGLGFLLLGPVILGSMYTGYKSIFISS